MLLPVRDVGKQLARDLDPVDGDPVDLARPTELRLSALQRLPVLGGRAAEYGEAARRQLARRVELVGVDDAADSVDLVEPALRVVPDLPLDRERPPLAGLKVDDREGASPPLA